MAKYFRLVAECEGAQMCALCGSGLAKDDSGKEMLLRSLSKYSKCPRANCFSKDCQMTDEEVGRKRTSATTKIEKQADV